MIESCRLIVMTKRMQVLFDDEEYRGIQRIGARVPHDRGPSGCASVCAKRGLHASR